MNIVVVTPPQFEPVTLADLYTWLRLDPAGSPPEHPDDALLTSLIQTARLQVEQETRRALVDQRLRLILPNFPRLRVLFSSGAIWGDGTDDAFEERPSFIEIPRPPLMTVHSVEYYDVANELQTLDPAAYFVSTETFCARINASEGYDWPDTFRRGDAVQIEYSAGYPSAESPPEADGVPDGLRTAIKVGVQLAYDEISPEKRPQLEKMRQTILASFRVAKF